MFLKSTARVRAWKRIQAGQNKLRYVSDQFGDSITIIFDVYGHLFDGLNANPLLFPAQHIHVKDTSLPGSTCCHFV